MAEAQAMSDASNGILPRQRAVLFIVFLGIVSLFGDMTYEGARSITGPYLGGLGATAATIGIVAGLASCWATARGSSRAISATGWGSIGRSPSPGICSTCSPYRSWRLPVLGRSPLY